MKTNEFEKGIKFSFQETIAYSEKAVVSKHVLKKKTGNISLFAFDQGEGLSEHTTPYDALVFIIDGTAEISIDGVSGELTSGEAIVLPANVPHALRAIQKFKMILSMIRD